MLHATGAAIPDHPRSRGEYGPIDVLALDGQGSSPLSRGIRNLVHVLHNRQGIIPALAGNTTQRGPYTIHTADHPRSRGEYSLESEVNCESLGSSPLSRGIRVDRIRFPQLVRIIPALAGNTDIPVNEAFKYKDHPRSRGEYTGKRRQPCFDNGSSPLSRGIHDRTYDTDLNARIIPALAGNTSAATFSTRTGPDHPRSRGEYEFLTLRAAVK